MTFYGGAHAVGETTTGRSVASDREKFVGASARNRDIMAFARLPLEHHAPTGIPGPGGLSMSQTFPYGVVR